MDKVEPAEPAQAVLAPVNVDPETLVLRGPPRRVIRFRKGVIVTATTIAIGAIVGLTWTALEPPTFRSVVKSDETRPANSVPSDALAGAPKTYGDVPQLGPPLPGDLGQPILERQRQLLNEPAAGSGVGRGSEQRAARRERAIAEEQAARSSSVMVQLARSGYQGATTADARATPVNPTAAGAQSPVRASGSQKQEIDFSPPTESQANSQGIAPPVSGLMLAAGTIIPASLITGLNSDLPGLVLAQVTENVRDSGTGHTVLIPQGARLLGRYDSHVSFGQKRVLLVWQRIIFPDGSSRAIEDLSATDTQGFAGLQDHVNFHEWSLLKGIALASLVGVGSTVGISGESDLARAVREATQQNAGRAGDQIVSHELDVQPTLTVRPGWPVRAIVQKDLALEPWSG